MNKVRIMMSNRHIHLTEADKNILFGKDYQFTVKTQITSTVASTEETVSLEGPRGKLEHVRVLLPFRRDTQVELLKSDCFRLGIQAPIRQSGDVKGSAALTVIGPAGTVELKQGVIIAARHIHMDTEQAKHLGIPDRGIVSVKTEGVRGVVFENVLVRVTDHTNTVMHLDMEEGNAADLKNNDQGIIFCQGTEHYAE